MAKKKSKTAPKKKKVAAASRGKQVTADASGLIAEKLQTLLEKTGTEDEILKLLAPLDDQQRSELAPMCGKWLRKQKKTQWIEKPPGTFRTNPLIGPAQVAVFSVCSFSEIKRVGRSALARSDQMLEILENRKPKWAGELAEMLLHLTAYWNYWSLVRAMVRLKLCSRPDDPRYYTGMISGLCGNRFSDDRPTVLSALNEDPALLKHEVWRLFEYEGEQDNTLANVDRWSGTSWSDALLTLEKEGRLSRPKLLSASLSALQMGFNHYRAKWFLDFLDALEPSDKEFRKHSETILSLVGSPTPNIAKWAYAKLLEFDERGIVKDKSRLAQATTPLLMARQKGTVIKVLKLLDRYAADSKQLSADVCLAATEALGHDNSDVQKAAFGLIAKHGSPDDLPLHEAVEQYVPVVAASFRKELKAWLSPGEAAKKTPSSPQKVTKSKGKKTTFDRKRLNGFSKHHLEVMKLEALIRPSQSDSDESAENAIPAATFDGTEIPRLCSNRRITPVENLEELLEVCGRAIEDDSLIDDAERAIDGLARLGNQRPENFQTLVGPVYKRARTLLKRNAPFTGETVVGDLCALIYIWVDGHTVTTRTTKTKHGGPQLEIDGLFEEKVTAWYVESLPNSFLSARSLEVAASVGKHATTLLSTPTHEGGWIDPREFVRRANKVTASPGETDLILALLRLAPDNKQAALKNFKPKSSGQWVNVVKHAMGGSGVRIGKSAAWWAAAARCRSPWDDDPRVAKAFPKLAPGAGNAPRFAVSFRTIKRGSKTVHEACVRSAGPAGKVAPLIPTQLTQWNHTPGMGSISFWDLGTTPGSIRWLATLWPAARDSYFAAGAQCLADNLDWWEAAWHNRCFMEPLIDPDTPPRDIGIFMLLCGLASKEPGEHGLATDILIQMIEDGRVGTDNLSQTLAGYLPSQAFNLPRLSKRLQEVAATSPLHAFVIMVSLESALSQPFSELPRGLGDLLELLGELSVELDRGVAAARCREFLESIKGSNKAAKAAKSALAHTGSFDPVAVTEMAISRRLDRLGQWKDRRP